MPWLSFVQQQIRSLNGVMDNMGISSAVGEMERTDCHFTRPSLPLVAVALLIAGLLHVLILVLLFYLPSKPPREAARLTIHLTAAAPASTAEQPLNPAPASQPPQQSPPVTIAPATPSASLEAPANPPEQPSLEPPATAAQDASEPNSLQRYLRGGPLPASVIAPAPAPAPVDGSSPIFSGKLREQVRQARARRLGRQKLDEQHYALSNGEQYQRVGDRCFVGRNMISESGSTRIWYPTACRGQSAAERAFDKLQLR